MVTRDLALALALAFGLAFCLRNGARCPVFGWGWLWSSARGMKAGW